MFKKAFDIYDNVCMSTKIILMLCIVILEKQIIQFRHKIYFTFDDQLYVLSDRDSYQPTPLRNGKEVYYPTHGFCWQV